MINHFLSPPYNYSLKDIADLLQSHGQPLSQINPSPATSFFTAASSKPSPSVTTSNTKVVVLPQLTVGNHPPQPPTADSASPSVAAGASPFYAETNTTAAENQSPAGQHAAAVTLSSPPAARVTASRHNAAAAASVPPSPSADCAVLPPLADAVATAGLPPAATVACLHSATAVLQPSAPASLASVATAAVLNPAAVAVVLPSPVGDNHFSLGGAKENAPGPFSALSAAATSGIPWDPDSDCVTQQQIDDIINKFDTLARKIHYMKSFEWGKDMNIDNTSQQGFTHVFEATFKSVEDVKKYLHDPRHEAFGQQIGPLIEKFLLIDYKPTKVKLCHIPCP
ncbi:hypothetical protein BUALT_Bualt01G0045600 [Buddleja alternifolia]|uniref:Stress-response A/B barrel domain-containing protein n=1 Tax=Buddleja alternifolia TaxID=168488 RepID=A0AAV6Y5F4_9LAMI|nr:hypothetical protein BUALT_Bualt01G0045600 [Buddleja alternifolia]